MPTFDSFLNHRNIDPLQTWKDYWSSRDPEYMNSDRNDAGTAQLLELQQGELQYRRSLPQNQLQQLMAAGMSRSAALQALSAMQYDPQSMPIAGNVEQSRIERLNAITNMVGQIAQVAQQVASIIEIGSQLQLNYSTVQLQTQQANFIAYQAKQQSMNNQVMQYYLQAYDASTTGIQSFANYSSRNNVPLPDDFNDALKIASIVNADSDPDLYNWYHTIHPEGMKSPFYYNMMKQAYSDIKKGDYELGAEKKRVLAQADYAQQSVEKLNAEISEILANKDLINEQISLVQEQVKTEIQHQYALHQQGFLAASQAALANEQTIALNRDNWIAEKRDPTTGLTFAEMERFGVSRNQYYIAKLAELDFRIEDEYISPLKTYQLSKELESWRSMPERYWAIRRDNLLKSEDNRRTILSVLAMSLADKYAFQNNHPTLFSLFNLFESYDVFSSALDATANVGAAAVGGAVTKGLVTPAASAHRAVTGFQ